MSASNYLAGATIAAEAFRGAQQGNAKFRPLMAWIEDIKPRGLLARCLLRRT